MAHAEKRWSKKDKRWYWRVKYRLPNGRWGSASRDDFGNKFTTQKLAEKFGHALETDVDRKVFVNPRDGRLSIRAWADLWLDSIEVGHLSERDYRSRLNAVILPEWGDVMVADLTTIAYATWEKKLRAEGRAPNSIRGIRSTFRAMMTDAVTSKVRGDNPIPDQKGSRRGKYKPKSQQDERVFADARQALHVARNGLDLRGPNLYALVLTSWYTGMRIGELAGLTRDCLVLDDTGTGARILLTHQSQYVDGKPQLVPAKYDSGRSLIIPPFLAELLRELVASRSSEWVFVAPKGGRLLIAGDFYRDTWRPIVDGRAPIPSSRGHKARPGIRPVLGVEGMTPHGLRHGHRVSLDEGGHPRVAIEERMGHELPGVEGTYSHTTLAMERKIAEYLQTLWEESLRPVVDRREFGPVPVSATRLGS